MTEVELVDIVDLEDRVIGVRPREELADAGLSYRVVHVLLEDGAGNLLLQKPAASRARAFRYGSSVAGHVRSGESYRAAAHREYLEELGLAPQGLQDLGRAWLDEAGRRKFIGVFVGTESRTLAPDPTEVQRVDALPIATVRRILRDEPEVFSPTFARVFRHVTDAGYLL